MCVGEAGCPCRFNTLAKSADNAPFIPRSIFDKTQLLPRGLKGGQCLPGWPGCEDSLVGGGGGGGKASLPPVDRVGVPWEKNHERFVRYDWENLW